MEKYLQEFQEFWKKCVPLRCHRFMIGPKYATDYEKWTLCSSTIRKIAVRKVSGSPDNPWNCILKPPFREIIQNMTEKISKTGVGTGHNPKERLEGNDS